jgi:3-deoxy-D-manno-octulosonic-acid transferase
VTDSAVPAGWQRRLGIMNAVATAGGIALLPVALGALAVKREWRIGLRERFGALAATPPGRRAIWIHGASVGELTALAPVVRALRHELPDERLLLSSMTVGGRLAAATRVPEADDRVLFPLDLPAFVARALDRVRPRLVLFSETELWPNFLAAVAARGIPAIMVSGRVSPSAFARYARWRWLFAPALIGVRWFCVQTLESARRLVALGAPASRIVVTGSLKTVAPPPAAAGALTLAGLGVVDRPVLIGASTHPGEDEPILDAFGRLRADDPQARLVLAPRKLDRSAEVVALVTARGFEVARRSALGRAAVARWPTGTDVLVLDSLGELAGLFAGARLAFVGGTLVPVGGHNLLEPAAAGTAVVFGPHTENVRADAERLRASGGGFLVASADDLVARLPDVFRDRGRAAAAGAAARAVVAAQQGPLAVTLAVVRATLAAGSSRA